MTSPLVECVALWRSGQGTGLAINTSRVLLPAAALPWVATLGQSFTHACLASLKLRPYGAMGIRLVIDFKFTVYNNSVSGVS